MHHHVAVDGIAPRVRTLRGRNRTADVAPLAQNVIPLYGNRSGVAFQETLRKLGVPDQLVGVHRLVIVSAAAALSDVGGQAHVPRHVDLYVSTVREIIRVQIGVLLKVVSRMLVVDVTVHAHFQQVVTEVEVHTFANVRSLRDALLAEGGNLFRRNRGSAKIRTRADITHTVGIVIIRESKEVEILLLADGRVKHHFAASVPVAADVHRHGGAAS